MPILNIDALKKAQLALREEGLAPAPLSGSKREVLDSLLESNALSLPNVVENISILARSAEKDELRYKANELALKLHGVLRDDEKAAAPTIQIQIAGENVNLGFLRPSFGD